MVKKNLIQGIVNIILLILFIYLLINTIIIHFKLIQPLTKPIKMHILTGWLFLLFMLIHIIMHIPYYKDILLFWRKK
ncbi:MAG: hypothetical protein ACOC3Z_02790 [Nanoarchaeota archaeon]